MGAISQKNSCTAKTAEKKSCKGNHRKKNDRASALNYPCPVFDLKKILAQAITHQKKSCAT